MAKKSKKRLGRQEKDQGGCMWSLINIFDFRHVRSSQKLLLDKKRGSRRLDGAVYANIKLESLSDSCHVCDDSNGTSENETNETLTVDTSKMSVKELMEEEMCVEQDREKHGSIAVEDGTQTAADSKGPVKKNRRWSRSKMSLDLEADGFVVSGDLVEKPNHRKHKSCGSIDLNEMVEELCNHIQHKDIRNLKRGEDGTLAIKPTGDLFVVEKQLAEAAKVLVKHFTDGQSSSKERKIQPSKELTDALQILNANKELFLKLLQDPNSQLVKHIQSLQDIQIEEGKFKVLTGSDLSQKNIGPAKQSNFFWRRFKGQERNSPRKSDTSVDLSRIVVLKPAPPSSKSSDVASTCSSESPRSNGDKDQIEKASSPFTFAEFKRKLKHAMRKEQRAVSHQLPLDEQPNLAIRDKKVSGEAIAMASPSRDHFFIERLPKSSVSFRKVDKPGKLKDGKMQLEHDPGLTPEQRVSSIYTEAKRHLAEIVGNNDVDVDTLGRKVPKSLGKILSYTGYSSPTICSPRIEADVRLSSDSECQTSNENTSSSIQETNVNLPDQVKQEPESEPCIPSDKPIHEEEVPAAESLIFDGLPRTSDGDEPSRKSGVPSSEDIMKALDAASEKQGSLLEISVEPSSFQDTIKTEQGDSSIYSEEISVSSYSEQNSDQENGHSSCPDSSTLNCSLSGKMEDLDAMSDATSRPSPISVLEAVFKEDEISPPSVKHFSGIEPIRPRQIKFEEEFSAPIGRVPSNRACVDYDKYTLEFVKDVVQMSGLNWDELLRRSLFSEHFIDPSLIDEVDFLPDLLPCDFNLLFDLVNEVSIELCWLNFGGMLSLATPFVQPSLKGKDFFSKVWEGVNWHLKSEGPPPTLDQIIAKDFAKPGFWAELCLDRENIGIQIQEAILDELLEDTILSCVSGSLDSEIRILQSAEEGGEVVDS